MLALARSAPAADGATTATLQAAAVFDAETTRTAATGPVKSQPSVKVAVDLKLPVVQIAEEPPSATLTPRAFLAQRLGKKFHPRSAWAGADPQLQPQVVRKRVWKPVGQVRFVTFHQAGEVPYAPPARMIRNIFNGHTTPFGRLDAADVGYHFFIDRNGDVWEGRDATIMGTHVGSTPDGLNNTGNIGICGLGTFTYTAPPKAMSDAAVNLALLLGEYYGRPLKVRGHDDWQGINGYNPPGGTDCPGKLEVAVKLAGRRMEEKFHLAAGSLAPPARQTASR